MNKKIWDLYAPIYERAMRANKTVYHYMYDRIPQIIEGKEMGGKNRPCLYGVCP